MNVTELGILYEKVEDELQKEDERCKTIIEKIELRFQEYCEIFHKHILQHKKLLLDEYIETIVKKQKECLMKKEEYKFEIKIELWLVPGICSELKELKMFTSERRRMKKVINGLFRDLGLMYPFNERLRFIHRVVDDYECDYYKWSNVTGENVYYTTLMVYFLNDLLNEIVKKNSNEFHINSVGCSKYNILKNFRGTESCLCKMYDDTKPLFDTVYDLLNSTKEYRKSQSDDSDSDSDTQIIDFDGLVKISATIDFTKNMETYLQFRPGGDGFKEAKRSFEQSIEERDSKKIKLNND